MTTRRVAIYDAATGEIRRVVTGPQSVITANIAGGEAALDVDGRVESDLTYVVDGALTARPTFGFAVPATAAPGDVLTLSAPEGAVLHVDAVPATTADGEGLEIELATPGAWRLEIACWPYVTLRQIVTVA
ncbi:MAG: hypothetical protein KA105_02845 [Caulobacter sp.]|nr:hypothetical protein [Caulobacter sp.]